MEKSEQILEAAAKRFAIYGFRRTVMDDIARDAGIAKGSLYLHAASKEELFIQSLKRERNLMLEAAREAASSTSTSTAAIHAVVLRILRWLDERPLTGRVMTGDPEMGLGPELGELVHCACQDEKEFYEFTCGLIQKGIDSGDFRRDLTVEAPATIVFSIFHIHLHNKQHRFIDMDDEVYIPELLRILFEGIMICERGFHAQS